MFLFFFACFSSYNPEFDVEKISDGTINQPEETYTEPDLDGDGYGLLAGDCDDSNPDINPDAEEICDFIDNNCNGLIDEGAERLWFLDEDADGFGKYEDPIYRCDPLPGYVDNDLDCDDTNPTVYPDAEELCDELDNNCEGTIDEGLTYPQYADSDGDGFGNINEVIEFCSPKEGYVEDSTDCDDTYDLTFPGAPEFCDGLDNDCNEEIDNNPIDAPDWYFDFDGDGFFGTLTVPVCIAPPDSSPVADDCNDTDPSISPGAQEICDEIDNNCDGAIDQDAIDAPTWYVDSDQDSFGDPQGSLRACIIPGGYVSNFEDCNDQSATINPNANEVCDGIDNNCNAQIDDDDPTIDSGSQNTFYFDDDGDGFGGNNAFLFCNAPSNSYVPNSDDCDDSTSNRAPNATEVCDNIDNDCDNTIDNNAVDALTWFFDADNDGFAGNTSTLSCTQPQNHYASSEDCNDNDASINPDADERCDSIDRNCDGSATQGAIDPNTYFADEDEDGFGDKDNTTQTCNLPNGYTQDDTDCNDQNGNVNPNATEVCNNTDDNCNGTTDENAADALTWFFDGDGDNFGDSNVSEKSCAPPEDYLADNTDCNDQDASINPGAVEVCDGIDNNCNPSDDTPPDIWFADTDGDGFGDPNNTTSSCTQPEDFVTNGDDCNDTSASIRPGGTEICNGLDDDCNNTVDDNANDAATWYFDSDSDGFGNPNVEVFACTAPPDHRENSADCDDNSALINPNATEVCDGIDNNCNGTTDDNDSTLDPSTQTEFFIDGDGDGFGDSAQPIQACVRPNNASRFAGDCDDNNASTNPDADEVCDNTDNNCNGSTDENAIDATTWFLDQDNDGYAGDSSLVSCTQPSNGFAASEDCDDTDSTINPVASELCDGSDNNCNGLIDDNPIDGTTFFIDSDGDGFGSNNSTQEACSVPDGFSSNDQDCDDSSANAYPNAPELCDGIDNDCDNQIDDADPDILTSELSPFYPDEDDDGFGANSSPLLRCSAPGGYTDNNSDCNDSLSDINPNAEEICDLLDNNCDGITDDDATDAPIWYGDTDGDGFGGDFSTLQQCDQPAGFFSIQEDCDDSNPNKNPNAPEVCNGDDDDCNGLVDDNPIALATWYRDLDEDGFGDIDETTESCEAPQGYVDNSLDCEDNDPNVNPDAEEFCDTIDSNCNGLDDDNDPAITVFPEWNADEDEDGYGDPDNFTLACTQPQGTVDNNLDCFDQDASINPDAEEVCDGQDNDCDGSTDINASDALDWFLDNDGDGFAGSDVITACEQPAGTDLITEDCNDENASIFPGATEVCNNEDDDCNGQIDDGATDLNTYYRDVDDDGFGNLLQDTQACSLPSGFSENGDDCNDNNSQINPDGNEICDTQDNDCDGLVDDDDPSVDPDSQVTFGFDNDGDGYGSSTNTIQACVAPSGYTQNTTDCDDFVNAINPGVDEECDGVDEDCDGVIDSQLACNFCFFDTFGENSYFFCNNYNFRYNIVEIACDLYGYDMVAIGSEEENLFIYESIVDYGGGRWFIGLNDRDQEDDYVWTNGEPFSYNAWADGEPNNSGNEDCVELNRFGDETWNDIDCDQSLRFICEAAP